MEIKITLDGKKRVSAEVAGRTIVTDQAERSGGLGTMPEPFTYFLASIGQCAGAYVQGFCDSRNLSSEGITISQNISYDPNAEMKYKTTLDINVPADFPEKYHTALIRSADQCAVKKIIQTGMEFETKTVVLENTHA
ncbi:MAG: OsmC family protein [Candidatus Kapabacteria bacterium]|jgi:putative redox protein|nr:OsmC family protein [Candidatus Kapabacteria bacterium]